MANILLVEDDIDLNKLVNIYLSKNGFDVTSCYNGLEALEKFQEQNFDIIISDIMMPKINGYELLEELRSINKKIPFLFMSAKDDIPSKQKGYDLGLDDYLAKPISNEELLMRVKALLRRSNIQTKNRIEIGNLLMDKDEYTAYVNEEDICLTVREFDILYHMISYPKKTFSRSRLMELFWDYDSSATSRTVDVYMAKLRDKTSECTGFSIQTVHGLGYKVILNEK